MVTGSEIRDQRDQTSRFTGGIFWRVRLLNVFFARQILEADLDFNKQKKLVL